MWTILEQATSLILCLLPVTRLLRLLACLSLIKFLMVLAYPLILSFRNFMDASLECSLTSIPDLLCDRLLQ